LFSVRFNSWRFKGGSPSREMMPMALEVTVGPPVLTINNRPGAMIRPVNVASRRRLHRFPGTPCHSTCRGNKYKNAGKRLLPSCTTRPRRS
jgi:hypothetical protein